MEHFHPGFVEAYPKLEGEIIQAVDPELGRDDPRTKTPS
jgi:hypothetical protein